MKCPFCESALPGPSAKFCPECGAGLHPDVQPVTARQAKTPPPLDEPKKCAAGPCRDVRLPGSDFCAKHGPKEMPKGGRSPKARPPGRIDRFLAKVEAEEQQKRSQDARIVCLYCQQAGQVSTAAKRVKRGVSGGKATGALITGGLSIFATGLSRKDDVIEARCANCGMVWQTQADR